MRLATDNCNNHASLIAIFLFLLPHMAPHLPPCYKDLILIHFDLSDINDIIRKHACSSFAQDHVSIPPTSTPCMCAVLHIPSCGNLLYLVNNCMLCLVNSCKHRLQIYMHLSASDRSDLQTVIMTLPAQKCVYLFHDYVCRFATWILG